MQNNERAAVADRAPEADRSYSTADVTTARSVSWWRVHQFVTDVTDVLEGGWPIAGTPAWCQLADDDPRKLAAVLDAGQHHALRIETAQEVAAEASQAISGAADWRAIAQDVIERRDFYARNPWAKRVVA